MRSLRAFVASVSVLLLAAPQAPAATTIDAKAVSALNAMRDLNLIVLGDYTAGAEVEGKVWVGGNVTGNTFNVGIGNANQSSGTSAYSSLTVVGDLGVSVNINNGATKNGTAGTGAYGVTVGGNVNQQLTFNGSNAVITVGGNLNADENIGANAVLTVAGYAKSVSGTGATTVKVGSISGGNANINVGAGSTVNVHGGGVYGVTTGDNSTIKVGGNVQSLTTGANTTATVTGTVGAQNFNEGNGSTVYAGAYGNNNVNSMGSCTSTSCTATANAYISGSDPNAQNDRNNYKQNGGQPAGWHFNQTQTLSAPDAPTAVNLSGDKTTMVSNMTDLTKQLSSLSANASATKMAGGSGIYDELFTVTNTSASQAVINVSASDLFGARNVGFNLNGYTGLVVINVTGVNGGTFNFTSGAYTSNGGVWDSSLNEDLIWNFGDATSTSTINVNSIFHGSILDVNGTVSNSTPIEGSVVASIFKQGGEVHLGSLAGDDTDPQAATAFNSLATTSTAVPEPATWSTMIIGFGAIGGVIRRQRRRQRAAA